MINFIKEQEYETIKTIEKQEEEIQRLNNIIEELEKWIKENDLGQYRTENVVDVDELLDKLKELKGGKNE